MTSFTVHGGRPLRGTIRVPGDKSISHRALLLAARAEGVSVVRGLSTGEDVAHTAAAIQAMGAGIDGDAITGGVARLHEPETVIDVGNSGTGIRLLAGFCAAFPWLTVLQGDQSVARRPMDRIVGPLREMGATVDGRADGLFPPLTIRGGALRGIRYTPKVASAQVKSAVLLAGLGAEGETTVVERRPTRAHTEELLALAGMDVVGRGDGITVHRGPLTPFELDVPGDPSQAAFWVVAATIVAGSELTVEGVYLGPERDRFLDVLDRMGADIERCQRADGAWDLRVRSARLRGTEIAGDEIPGLVDEVPVLAVAAAVADGVTVVRDASEARVKETDRLATVTSELTALGARVEQLGDGLVVPGGARLRGARVVSHGDHRIAMAMAVAGLAAVGETEIDGWDAVATSYPGFEQALETCVS
ncbi:MAG TPA: 3-phosphoshikimate 1-carboxyvinyltransferase [Acidimicrobiales bacterium]|nr:3-phosphoshikimate 1-carboxyvinyltransferase [Acidimicrobiales bacterium]